MPQAFVLQSNGERKIVLHCPIIMTLVEADKAIDDLLTAMLRAREPELMQEGEIFPVPPPRPECPRATPPVARTIDDLML